MAHQNRLPCLARGSLFLIWWAIEHGENLGGNAVGIAVYFANGEMDEPLMAHQKGVAPLWGGAFLAPSSTMRTCGRLYANRQRKHIELLNREGALSNSNLFSPPWRRRRALDGPFFDPLAPFRHYLRSVYVKMRLLYYTQRRAK